MANGLLVNTSGSFFYFLQFFSDIFSYSSKEEMAISTEAKDIDNHYPHFLYLAEYLSPEKMVAKI